uniref:Uncharacterized protein n=1 Tax=Octopus bimaculoides TaxID=37653 RepID=A0A0L8HCB9_OCTBM
MSMATTVCNHCYRNIIRISFIKIFVWIIYSFIASDVSLVVFMNHTYCHRNHNCN